MQTYTNYINEADTDCYCVGTLTRFNGRPYRIAAFHVDSTIRQTREGWGWQATFVQATIVLEPVKTSEGA